MTAEPIVVRRVVDDRIFLSGLDQLYRDAMRRHEAGELLVCARKVCDVLNVAPADAPVEGYYAEEPALTEYFRRIRALQNVNAGERSRLVRLAAFQRLEAVTSSPLYGKPGGGNTLLPTGKDPLSTALDTTPVGEWRLSTLVPKAGQIARDSDDFSLVGLAAFAGDAVVLTALRETAVLYAHMVASGVSPPMKFVYEWRVDPELAARADRFVSTFNALFQEQLATPHADNAVKYWAAASESSMVWRCVRIGCDLFTQPTRQFHWTIVPGDGAELRVHEFWHDDIWTTERFRSHLMQGKPLP